MLTGAASLILKASKIFPRHEHKNSSVILTYIDHAYLRLHRLGHGFVWLNTGTCHLMLDADHFVEAAEKRQGYKIVCLEEIAYNRRRLTKEPVKKTADELAEMPCTEYFSLLFRI